MKRKYECLYIIGSQISDDKRGELITKFSKMAGANTAVDKWGMRKFATPIQYRKEGFYVLMNFEADTDLINKMSSVMNITEGIVRYMFVCKDEKQIKADVNRKTQRAEARARFTGETKSEPKHSTEQKTDAPKTEVPVKPVS